jgi:oligopeptide/dipeptide ABC transporter ATP-binding protein
MASIPALPRANRGSVARLAEIPGAVPSLVRLPPGCAFAPRCPLAVDRCRAEYPPLQNFGRGQAAACWRAAELAAAS